MAGLGFPWQMGNVPPGTQLLLLRPDGAQITYTVPSTVAPFSDLPNAYQHGLVRVVK